MSGATTLGISDAAFLLVAFIFCMCLVFTVMALGSDLYLWWQQRKEQQAQQAKRSNDTDWWGY